MVQALHSCIYSTCKRIIFRPLSSLSLYFFILSFYPFYLSLHFCFNFPSFFLSLSLYISLFFYLFFCLFFLLVLLCNLSVSALSIVSSCSPSLFFLCLTLFLYLLSIFFIYICFFVCRTFKIISNFVELFYIF